MTGAAENRVLDAPRPSGVAALWAWLRDLAGGSLTRNGYALIANVAITSALGFVFWLFAARLYPADVVGRNAALMSVLMTICVIAQLNLASVLTRFLPVLGRREAAGWITRAYGASAAATVVAAAVFVAGVNWLVPSMGYLVEAPAFTLWFIAACVAWNVLALQEGALAGLRSAIWIPAQNTIAGIGKILLLLVFAGIAFSEFAPFVAWTVPVAAAVVLVNILIFGRLLRSRSVAASASPPGMAAISRYLGGDYFGQVLFSATFGLSSVLVVEFISPAANAVYYVALTMAYALYLISKSMTVSLVAEAAADEQKLAALAWRALGHSLAVVSLGALFLCVAAPLILNLYGPSYAAEGILQLRLLALSAVPFALTATALGVARVQRRMAFVAFVQGAMAILVLGLALPLIDAFGSAGMAVSWLVGQCLVAPVAIGITAARLGWRP